MYVRNGSEPAGPVSLTPADKQSRVTHHPGSQNLCAELPVPPVIDSTVDLRTARSGNPGGARGNSPSFPGHRTNQSVGPIHRASLATGAAPVRISDMVSYFA